MKRILLVIASMFFVSACSHSPKKDTGNAPVVSSDDSTRSPIAQILKSKAQRVEYVENELANAVSEYIAGNPRSDYDDVASFATKKMKEVGFAFDLISFDAEPQGAETFVKTTDGQLLNVGMYWEPLCAEGVAVRYPITGFKGDVWTVKYKNGTYTIRAKPIRFGEILKVKDQKKVTEVPIPEEGFEPGGITDNGKAILAKLALNPSVNGWWRQVMRRDPKEEPPFLVIYLTEDGIQFSKKEEDLDLYEDKPARQSQEDDTYQITYPDSKYKFRSTACT